MAASQMFLDPVCIVFVMSCCCPWLLVAAHPQCLDFLPPFSPASALMYCSQYSSFTCCSRVHDANVRAGVQSLEPSIANAPRPTRCGEMLKAVRCARCSPYASHVFSAESTGTASAVAGLCPDYCQEMVTACGMDLVQNISNNGNKSYASGGELCAALKPADADYCVPYVQNFTSRLADQSLAAAVGDLNCLCVKEVMSGLRNPVLAVHAGDASHRLFVGEQLGVVRAMLANGSIPAAPFVDLQDLVVTSAREGDERGLLGMAFHPNHSRNGLVFFHLNVRQNSAGQHGLFNRVLRFRVREDNPNMVNRSTSKTIIEVRQPYGNHNGGEIFFGVDDGYLYIFLGDGGSAGDPANNGLDRSTLLGSVLRIDVDADDDTPYLIPPSNPFTGANALPQVREEIFAYGMRNPWRCSQDIGDRRSNGTGRGRIFCGDVGQASFEEIDLIESGQNYGWRAWEGDMCYDAQQCKVVTDSRFPIHQYPHSVGKSVTGGYVYRGCLSPNLQGLYIYGDFVNGRMFSLEEVASAQKWKSTELCFGGSSSCNNGLTNLDAAKFILSFGQDESGEIYVLATNFAGPTSAGGKVYWLVDPARRGDPAECRDYFATPGNTTENEIPIHFVDGGNGPVDFDPSSTSGLSHSWTWIIVTPILLASLLS